jgi:glycosyltransferase involved in cell wall biosynthesis
VLFNWGDYYAEMMPNYPKFIVSFMENYAIKNSDYITTVSKRNEKIAKKYNKKVFYIPHGYFKSNKKSKLNLDKLKTKKHNLKIIYLGEQSKWKKVDHLIKAVKGLDCDLFLIGHPNEEFKKISPSNVHFINYINELEVRSVLKQADILVNTSNQDCNYKLFEYISIGKPILAFNGLPANIFTHKETAYLTKDFKQGLIELIKNKELRIKLSKNVKKIKTYSWDEITEIYLNLFQKIINKQI